mmetsp:Transcript_8752/g.21574  ORF Transcript_8752/g.21574 Transcript_8752/m.21574 type:complete len:214 (-) Transcript_8752:385-1026(-)
MFSFFDAFRKDDNVRNVLQDKTMKKYYQRLKGDCAVEQPERASLDEKEMKKLKEKLSIDEYVKSVRGGAPLLGDSRSIRDYFDAKGNANREEPEDRAPDAVGNDDDVEEAVAGDQELADDLDAKESAEVDLNSHNFEGWVMSFCEFGTWKTGRIIRWVGPGEQVFLFQMNLNVSQHDCDQKISRQRRSRRINETSRPRVVDLSKFRFRPVGMA